MTRRRYTYYAYPTAHGAVTLQASDDGLTRVVFGEVECEGARRPCEITNRAATQLQEYLAGKREWFDIPLAPEGTAFQHSVWEEIARIPYGQMQTPGEIAANMGNPGNHRAVGLAARKCPLAPFIPAQRVAIAAPTDRDAKIRAALAALEHRNGASLDW